jgi:allantoinase
VTLVVRGGTVVTPGSPGRTADVVVADTGRIVAVMAAGEVVASGAEILDADGLLVLPGMVDAHVHFDEPGREDWEGFDTGSAAAAAGGVTTVVDMPIDCDPPTTSAGLVAAKAQAAERHSRVDVAVWGGLVPASVGRLGAMVDAGVVGFKAFACPSGWDEFPPADEETLAAGMAAAARFDVPVAVHCELAALGHTIESEVAAVGWAAGLAAAAGARLHVVHASSAAAVDEAARWPGVTVETCPHYLVLDERDTTAIGPTAHCFPPIRDAANREELWARLGRPDGSIHTVASDHSPCPPARRAGPEPWGGIDSIGVALPFLLSSGRLTLDRILELTTAAARLLRLPAKGRIEPGFDADLALYDLGATWEIGPATQWSRHRQSPYAGRQVTGRVMATLVRGRLVYSVENGPCPPGGARVLAPERGAPRVRR